MSQIDHQHPFLTRTKKKLYIMDFYFFS